MKLLIIGILIAILASLASAMYFLVRDKGKGQLTTKTLAIRIALSILLFVLIMIGYKFGLIELRSHP